VKKYLILLLTFTISAVLLWVVFSQIKPCYRLISGVSYFNANGSGFGTLPSGHVHWGKDVRQVFCPLNKRKTFIPITVLISGIISS